MDMNAAVNELLKIKANVSKEKNLDKAKSDAAKDLDRVLNAVKPLLETKKKLVERIKSKKTLEDEIADYNDALKKVTSDARAGSKAASSAAQPDTANRDFRMMANYLQIIGQEQQL